MLNHSKSIKKLQVTGTKTPGRNYLSHIQPQIEVLGLQKTHRLIVDLGVFICSILKQQISII